MVLVVNNTVLTNLLRGLISWEVFLPPPHHQKKACMETEKHVICDFIFFGSSVSCLFSLVLLPQFEERRWHPCYLDQIVPACPEKSDPIWIMGSMLP